jgi:WXG100 family type VII secretion target
VDSVLSYNFNELECSVRQEIHGTAARFNAALQELKSHVAPLQELWTREAATAYGLEQLKWHQAATALNEILVDLGNAVRDGAEDIAAADHRTAGVWDRQRQ